MQNISINVDNIQQKEISKSKVALMSVSVGLLLVYLIGLSHPMAIHNAAHDVRHTMSFPCH